jgi:hypothetical protein
VSDKLTRDPEIRRLLEDLAEPFDPREIKWKPQSVKGNRAMAIAYVDARLIQDRLDDALGPENWSDEYTPFLGGKSVLCRLTLNLAGTLVSKMDIGGESEQPDEGDRSKAAVSDALKRAAVKWGIGRYLYRLPIQWVDYDQSKRQFVNPPKLPAFAIPPKSRPEVTAQRGRAIEGLIRYVCGVQQIDAAKTIADQLAGFRVESFADLKASDADALIQRLGAKIAELATGTPAARSKDQQPKPQPQATGAK